MAKEILYGKKLRKKLKKGSKELAKAVGSTMGALGSNVLMQHGLTKPHHISKDGVTVAEQVILPDPTENLACSIIKQAAKRTAKEAGDGTTTTIVLADAIFRNGANAINGGASPIMVQRGAAAAMEKISKCVLDNYSVEIDTDDQVYQIARISANGDEVIGDLVASTVLKVGKSGVINVVESKQLEDSVDIVNGMEWEKGYLSPHFVNNRKKGIVELDNPLLITIDGVVDDIKRIVEVVEIAQRKPVVFIAEDFNQDVLNILAINTAKKAINVCAVKAPGYGDRQKEYLRDISILTGGAIFDFNVGESLTKASVDMAGHCKRFVANRDSSVIIEGAGEPELIKKHVEELTEQLKHTETEFDKGKLEKRIANMQGGVAIIKVGGGSEAEAKERKDRVDDAIGATKAAIEDGILPGGGIDLARIDDMIENNIYSEELEIPPRYVDGYMAVVEACYAPMKRICKNAGLDYKVILDKCTVSGLGYNVLTGEAVDSVEAGIIDPTKVTVTALRNAVSVAGILLTASCAIQEEEGKNNELPDLTDMGSMLPM